jgi:serine/threonine protein kinase
VWPELPSRLQIHFNSVLAIINAKLIAATNLLDIAIGKPMEHQPTQTVIRKQGKPHRGAFAISLKDTLEATIRDLDAWRDNMLDPSWFQLVRVSSQRVDDVANQHERRLDGPIEELDNLRKLIHNEDASKSSAPVFLHEQSVQLTGVRIEFSESNLGIHSESGSSVIMDAVKPASGIEDRQTILEARDLARRFRSNEVDTFGLLKCIGILKDTASFNFLFQFPSGLSGPVSLRRLLLDADSSIPLNCRLNIGQKLARSIMFLHSLSFVHKNIRAENIVCFSSHGESPDRPYLLGFEMLRQVDEHSMRMSDALWQRDIYRHPGRQGTRPEQDYIFQHDIYSLGVCLLEIGLWKSFLRWPEKVSPPVPNDPFLLPSDLTQKDPRKRAFEIKKKFVQLARDRLPGLMGDRYTSVVISCLTCLDTGNADFGDQREFLDDDGILVGVRYIEKVGVDPVYKQILTVLGTSETPEYRPVNVRWHTPIAGQPAVIGDEEVVGSRHH